MNIAIAKKPSILKTNPQIFRDVKDTLIEFNKRARIYYGKVLPRYWNRFMISSDHYVCLINETLLIGFTVVIIWLEYAFEWPTIVWGIQYNAGLVIGGDVYETLFNFTVGLWPLVRFGIFITGVISVAALVLHKLVDSEQAAFSLLHRDKYYIKDKITEILEVK